MACIDSGIYKTFKKDQKKNDIKVLSYMYILKVDQYLVSCGNFVNDRWNSKIISSGISHFIYSFYCLCNMQLVPQILSKSVLEWVTISPNWLEVISNDDSIKFCNWPHCPQDGATVTILEGLGMTVVWHDNEKNLLNFFSVMCIFCSVLVHLRTWHWISMYIHKHNWRCMGIVVKMKKC